MSRLATGNGTPPHRVLLVLVAVERYEGEPAWDLPGPAADARRFAEWFWARGVPSERTLVLASPLPDSAASWSGAPVEIEAATHENVRAALVRRVAASDGDLLVVVWGGHGMVATTGRRHLLTADATRNDVVGIDVDDVLALHRSSAVPSFPHQIWVVDACQTFHDGSRRDLPREDFGARDITPGRTQEVLFAVGAGQRATNRPVERTGDFSREVLHDLRGDGTWPPDVPALAERLQARFAAQRARGLAWQTPTYLWFRDRSGREGQLLGSMSPNAPAAAPARWPNTAELSRLVECLVALPEYQSPAFRDELLALLRREISHAIPRSTRTRSEAVGLIRTCARFPGGLEELEQILRLCAGHLPEVEAFTTILNNRNMPS